MSHEPIDQADHRVSDDDRRFRQSFEACQVSPAAFTHEAHVRLAYIYLCGDSIEGASHAMKQSILAFLNHLGADPAKFHETLTRAWIMAVHYFLSKSGGCASAAEFIAANPELLDSKIMLTHYSAAVLFSADARAAFVHPDIQSIPPPPRA